MEDERETRVLNCAGESHLPEVLLTWASHG